MPELPEVETTRRGLEPHLAGQTILRLTVHDHRLRWPVAAGLPQTLAGQRVESVERRAKYLLLRLTHGTVLWHLGMSGSLRIVPSGLPTEPHDHIDLALTSGHTVRFNDPRRFGCVIYVTGDPQAHPLLAKLAPEPFAAAFDAGYLWRVSRRRKVSVKQLIMNGQVVTGVGNIYASEVLFHSGIRPRRQSRSLKRAEVTRLVAAIRKVLKQAIRVGGTTLRDYVNPEGNPGYFRQKLYVYERAGEPCRNCDTLIRSLTQGQRSTYYCPTCQS
ncbi:MAG TPA: bifunctional DNA-formamidopyrimidine glycosylase/DNA-(apurinic or apyrimidinic site) lyase [Steroidobacteraceae bacterium]|jgi:formamidopyrimidine-DNA glycosylase|nr:bifunctional DNA-formamidopyrimidine glycosylase/DNA-(apurinic or apyrimidinic site) lyase [Steroidobacteraceae bacterium]